MVDKVEMWKASDGTLHDYLSDAENHEKIISLQKNFPDIIGNFESTIDYYNFIKWVEENEKYCADLFRALLQTVLKDY